MISDVRVTPRARAAYRANPRWLLAGALAMLATIAGPATAQTTTSTIRGYVRAGNAAPITDAQIAARSLELNQTRSVVTNASGFYSIPGLRPGRYEVTIRRIGFAAQTRAIDVPIAQTVTLDVQLQDAATQLSTVTVTATASQTAQTSEVGTNVSREQIQNLPTFDRNFLDLARLAPGIPRRPSTTRTSSSRPVASHRKPSTSLSTARRTRTTCCAAGSPGRTRARETRSRRAPCRSSA
jgi:hypothetical protein